MVKLSIIIPAYNVEKYIEKTISSIVKQDFPNNLVEIIVINDGSPDKSADIVQSIIDKGEKIILHHQTNQGLSMARNTGLDIASGEYVWFVDSDDWIEKGCISDILSMLDGSVDEINFEAYSTSEDGTSILGYNSYTKHQNCTLSGIEIWRKKIPHIATAQLSIYRKAFLDNNKLRFTKGIYHEDYEFCIKASYLSQKTIVLDRYYYYQRVNPNSITHVANPKKSYDYLFIANSINDFIREMRVEDDLIPNMHFYISMAINNALDNICKTKLSEQKSFNDILKKQKKLLNSLLMSHHLSYIAEWIFLKILPLMYSNTYKLLKRSV